MRKPRKPGRILALGLLAGGLGLIATWLITPANSPAPSLFSQPRSWLVTCPSSGRAAVDETDLPESFYVPLSSPVSTPRLTDLAYRQLDDGTTELLIYSSKEKLAACQGQERPWAQLPADRLTVMRFWANYDTVTLDAPGK
jgi:hypothetical protein